MGARANRAALVGAVELKGRRPVSPENRLCGHWFAGCRRVVSGERLWSV